MYAIWLAENVSCLVRGYLKIRNLFPSPITLSTCIRLLEIFLSFLTVLADNLFFPVRKVGVLTVIPFAAKISWTLNPLSAITLSPGGYRSVLMSSHEQSL